MEVAEDVSSKSVVSRTCRQCPKMFKDLSRAGKMVQLLKGLCTGAGKELLPDCTSPVLELSAKQEMNATKTRGNAWKKGRHSLQSSSPSRSRHFKCPSARMQGIAQQESIADRGHLQRVSRGHVGNKYPRNPSRKTTWRLHCHILPAHPSPRQTLAPRSTWELLVLIYLGLR
ncbi:uncharacterized protein [Heterodontus francisci]|uniref:uncharacterized protein isoform X4 n=1 Tax=Heterodontus francisci TaxID=7792 RepID=UPI00355B307D